ncbi:hypothetical protein NEOKW01_1050 [Nematocida sp. AWRm80]|nr:hypothetical protein NEOKW01_1050 [Nematocida sp. AWRm80]
MLYFIVIAAVIPLIVIMAIRRNKKDKGYYLGKYDNRYLKEYLTAPADTNQIDLYRMLLNANMYIVEQEEEIDEELKSINSLFYARLISSNTWEDIKQAREEMAFDKLTIDAELGRFEKVDKPTDIKRTFSPNTQTEYPAEENNEAKKALYKRIIQKRAQVHTTSE